MGEGDLATLICEPNGFEVESKSLTQRRRGQSFILCALRLCVSYSLILFRIRRRWRR